MAENLTCASSSSQGVTLCYRGGVKKTCNITETVQDRTKVTKKVYALSIGTKFNDLGWPWSWTADTHSRRKDGCDTYVIISITYVRYATAYVNCRTMTSLNDENKLCVYRKLLTIKVHKSQHWTCHWFSKTTAFLPYAYVIFRHNVRTVCAYVIPEGNVRSHIGSSYFWLPMYNNHELNLRQTNKIS